MTSAIVCGLLRAQRCKLMFGYSHYCLLASCSSLTGSHMLFCVMVHYPHTQGKIDYSRIGKAQRAHGEKD